MAKLKNTGKKIKFHDIDAKIEEAVNSNKTKTILELNFQESASIKSFAVKQSEQVKLTTRFLFGKMLIIVKLSLMSFIYEMLETLCFPNKKVQEIYRKYGTEKIYIYPVLTDAGSTSLKFLFVSDTDRDVPESKHKDIIFEVITASEVYNRFESSHEYWEKFDARNEDLRKFLGYFEIEDIDDPCILTIASNPKEYFEMFGDKNITRHARG